MKKNTGAIEIYLFAKKPKSKEGISITQAMKKFTYVNLDDFSESQDTSIMRYDTKLHTFIFAGKLDLPKQENIGELFIESSEIVGLDPSKTDVVLTKSAALKLSKLPFNTFYGTPFIICENKRPIFTGYFWSGYSSLMSTTFQVMYDHVQKDFASINHFKMYKANGFGHEIGKVPEIEKYPEIQKLTEAFKRDNKII
ncbi:MAG: hypothetical protein NWQ09_06500, partial [Nonlabens sp.]|nr:hypothetical protein [Nonlabens sp.]